MFSKAFVLLLFLIGSVTMARASQSEIEAQAQACALSGDYECSFALEMQFSEDDPSPLIDKQGYQLLSGARLEASLIFASETWSSDQTLTAIKRYLAVMDQRHPNAAVGYATPYGLAALTCRETGDIDCFTKHLAYLCKNRERLAVPMNRHPRFKEFSDKVVGLLINECGKIE